MQTESGYKGRPTIDKMAQLIKDKNIDYNEFETHEGICDSCGKERDVRKVHDADNAGDTLFGDTCDDCLDAAYGKAIAEGAQP